MRMLVEFDGPGADFRPDGSGIRGQGADRPAMRRARVFPYDRPVSYGTPQDYDRGTNGGTGGLYMPITPKDTAHSAWDEASEAMGVPSNAELAGRGGNTPADGGTGWAKSPPRAWDDVTDDEDRLLSVYGEASPSVYTFDPQIPGPEGTPRAAVPQYHDGTDDDLERKLDRLYGRPDSVDIVPARDVPPDIVIVSTGGLGLMGRGVGRLGLFPHESAWEALARVINKR